MKTRNTDIPLEIMAKIDALVKLFDGDIDFTTLMCTDIPMVRAMVQARLSNLARSRELLKTGQVDSFSRKEVSSGIMRPGIE
jgi:hypothetical protein